jgi:aerobic carbon-monoxide dehydrogenase medium subunit
MFDGTEQRSLTVAGTVAQAVEARTRGAAVLAGATWLMRCPLRGHDLPDELISLHRLPGMCDVVVEAGRINIGAAVTHENLARSIAGLPGLEALVTAASSSANPAIRRVATVGGNLCTHEFAAADLVPAFLALDATVELETGDGPQTLPIEAFIANRRDLLTGAILSRVIVPRTSVASAHARLPLRRAGDYPVAIVSVARDIAGQLRIAVGSVEDTARRWTALETALADPAEQHAGPDRAAALAAQCNDFQGRDGIEADGWYRTEVLPTLVRRAMSALVAKETGR